MGAYFIDQVLLTVISICLAYVGYRVWLRLTMPVLREMEAEWFKLRYHVGVQYPGRFSPHALGFAREPHRPVPGDESGTPPPNHKHLGS